MYASTVVHGRTPVVLLNAPKNRLAINTSRHFATRRLEASARDFQHLPTFGLHSHHVRNRTRLVAQLFSARRMLHTISLLAQLSPWTSGVDLPEGERVHSRNGESLLQHRCQSTQTRLREELAGHLLYVQCKTYPAVEQNVARQAFRSYLLFKLLVLFQLSIGQSRPTI